ncbi:hypothetical protein D9611_011702 [Ephemerocybe angulata]|uniref:Uncharacterized protein n=1 Tax=Ephemerocybe angulata TaxID=980116 RepID=A0A8H5C587_9AGAR|nr:hypothetical protein D9611_011702 [Tulosesus angulatus]
MPHHPTRSAPPPCLIHTHLPTYTPSSPYSIACPYRPFEDIEMVQPCSRPRPTSKLETLVLSIVSATLGEEHTIRPEDKSIMGKDLHIYSILGKTLPFPSQHSKFWWTKLGRPFASMLETSNYSLQAQCRFLCFFYWSVMKLLPPIVDNGEVDTTSLMTVDGGPVELSWVMPNALAPLDPKPHETSALNARRHRQVRFAIEPMNSVTGRRLRGDVVLDYLSSPQGSLGMIPTAKDDMEWRKKTESFLFPDDEGGDDLQTGSRFFVGFDFAANGTVSLKAYYLPGPSPPAHLPLINDQTRPVYMWDTNYEPLRRLVFNLNPGLMEPLELLLSYFESLDDDHRPRIQILAMDCVKSSENRLKIYCRPKRGAAWSDAVRELTLGGRIQTPEVNKSISHLRRLWDSLFPQATSTMDCDLRPSALAETRDGNGIKLNQAEHPVDGLLYYYSLFAGEKDVFPKIYLPVTQYCSNDLAIARAIEHFYSKTQATKEKGWNVGDVSRIMNHRPLSEGTGIHTYVTFGLKKKGFEVTNYFSPEVYRRT